MFLSYTRKEKTACETSDHDMIGKSAAVIMGIAVSHICDCQPDCSQIISSGVQVQSVFPRKKNCTEGEYNCDSRNFLLASAKKTY